MKNSIFVNFLGTPCSGKSTLAAGLFHALKTKGYDTEICSEYAKEMVWAGSELAFKDQFYLSGVQHHRQFCLQGKVDVIITDSSLIAGLIYDDNPDLIEKEHFTQFLIRRFRKQRNLNFRVRRNGSYNPVGRVHTEEQSLGLDKKLDELLYRHDIRCLNIVPNESAVAEAMMYTLASLGSQA